MQNCMLDGNDQLMLQCLHHGRYRSHLDTWLLYTVRVYKLISKLTLQQMSQAIKSGSIALPS